MTNLAILQAFFTWLDSSTSAPTFTASEDNGDGTQRVTIAASRHRWGVVVRDELLRSIFAELELWQWLTDMACTVQANADINAMKWSVIDVDGELIGAGNTPTEAISDAKGTLGTPTQGTSP